jgi:poly(3-hydroxybutyrate) depolymerase
MAASGPGDISGILHDGPAIPTIVFHGDQDATVHPRNGDHAIAQSMRPMHAQPTVHRGRVPGGHSYTRTMHADAGGQTILEHWDIHGAGHAWSGGSPAGSYTDPRTRRRAGDAALLPRARDRQGRGVRNYGCPIEAIMSHGPGSVTSSFPALRSTKCGPRPRALADAEGDGS